MRTVIPHISTKSVPASHLDSVVPPHLALGSFAICVALAITSPEAIREEDGKSGRIVSELNNVMLATFREYDRYNRFIFHIREPLCSSLW